MRRALLLVAAFFIVAAAPSATAGNIGTKPSMELARHLTTIAALTQASPVVTVPEGTFILGSRRIDDDPYGLWTQFDDTELPQQQIWLDTFEIDRDEVTLAEFLEFLQQRKQNPSDEVQKLIWHVITVHSVSDHTLARWPALYVTWYEANDFCAARGKRLPT